MDNHKMFWIVFVACLLSVLGACATGRSPDERQPDLDNHHQAQPDYVTRPDDQSWLRPPISIKPDNEGDAEYATDLVVYASCESEGQNVTTAKDHLSVGECEIINITPAMNNNGDFYEVAALFEWTVQDPETAVVKPFSGPTDNIAHVIGKQDVFDTSDGQEPMTAIQACAINSCPNPPQNCPDKLCTFFTVTSVVNIEGAWLLQNPVWGPVSIKLYQNGRRVTDDWLSLDGYVTEDGVFIEDGDYFYLGTIEPDRTHMNGEYWDAMNYVPLGTWQAEKLSP